MPRSVCIIVLSLITAACSRAPGRDVVVARDSADDTLTVELSEDAWLGDAEFAASIDGHELGRGTVTALHATGATQSFTWSGSWGPGQHTVTVAFLNDAWGGTPDTDRNLHVDAIVFDGTTYTVGAIEYSQGSQDFVVTGAAAGNVLRVGPGEAYARPCDAVAAAQPGDEIDVAGGTYTDSCEINVPKLVVKGVGGRPVIDLSGTDHPADWKGIYVVQADGVRLENLELTGAHIPADYGENGAGVRIAANDVVISGCYIHDNQDGILGSPPSNNAGTVTIERTELSHNGLGNGCFDGNGCTHNVYIGHFGKLVFQYNWSHDIAVDGHLVKSRAAESDILYNRISGQDGGESFDIDLPNGGLAILVGNLIEHGRNANNRIIVDYAEEGLANPDHRIYAAYNTMVDDRGGATFFNVAGGGALTAHDNILVGSGAPSNLGALPGDNLVGADAQLVDAAHYDYRLAAASPAIGAAVAPGEVDGRSLVPTAQYAHPTSSATRAAASNLGALQ
ncbi:MAG: right-handed parallel beta-helix repeat-containing protein [Myxococcales bacterium]|nr:right-handed parallel beta-helix repeat-containing protein [Myxococcales bacterium]